MIASRVTQTTQAAGNAAGEIWATGANQYGELGLGDQTDLTGASTLQRAALNIDRPTAVSAGLQHSLALDADGSVWAWGDNSYGLLGLGPEIPWQAITRPAKVVDLLDVIAISAGGNHSLALRVDGTVWAWGNNSQGQLGDGTLTDHTAPARVPALGDVIAISAGVGFSLALQVNGQVWAWGSNTTGQLGTLSTAAKSGSSYPVLVEGLDNVAVISAGGFHCLALKANGTVWAWGWNNHGQLGDGSTKDQAIPIQVPTINDAIGIAAGGWHSLALTADGYVSAAGLNDSGQLGDGTTIDQHGFVSVTMSNIPIAEVVEVAAGNSHSLARFVDGSVLAWGYGNAGRLGTGSEADVHEPAPVLESPDAFDVPSRAGQAATHMTAIAAGTLHSLLIRGEVIVGTPTNGTIAPQVFVSSSPWVWGSGDKGQLLGKGFWPKSSWAVSFDSRWGLGSPDLPASAIAADASRSVSTDAAGTFVWGATFVWEPTTVNENPNEGPLAPSSLAPSFPPNVAILADGPFGMVVVALMRTGATTLTWRYGDDASLSLVPGTSPWSWGTTAVAVGGQHGLMLRQDGTVFAWGSNDRGQLGIGSVDAAFHAFVTSVEGLRNVVAIAAGSAHSVALLADGTVWAWGANDLGQLGDGTTIDRDYPLPVKRSGLPILAKAIAAYGGGDHTLALAPDGTVWAWGWNYTGQIGDGSLTNQTEVVQTQWHHAPGTHRPISGVKAVAAGRYHSLALFAHGHVFGWGLNDDGQLGDGGTDPLHQPYGDHPVVSVMPPDEIGLQRAYALESVTAIAAGERHSLALGRNSNLLKLDR
jgi:alpha-tubulin suppressor-like RCC1 family protein